MTEVAQKGDPRAKMIYPKWSGMKLFHKTTLLSLSPHEIYLKCVSLKEMEDHEALQTEYV